LAGGAPRTPIRVLTLFVAVLFTLLVLLLISKLVVNAVVKVLIVEFLVGSVELTTADPEPQHDILLFHKWRTILGEASLLVYISLA